MHAYIIFDKWCLITHASGEIFCILSFNLQEIVTYSTCDNLNHPVNDHSENSTHVSMYYILGTKTVDYNSFLGAYTVVHRK